MPLERLRCLLVRELRDWWLRVLGELGLERLGLGGLLRLLEGVAVG